MATQKSTIIVTLKDQVTKSIGKIKRSFVSLGTSAKKLGVIFAGVSTSLATMAIGPLKAAANFEKLQVSFTTILGSAEESKKLLGDIEKFSASTPLQFDNIALAAQRLLAFGTAQDDVIQKLTNLGNAAQGDQARLDRLTDAYGKLQAKGRASLEELNRFTEAGVPIQKELQKQFNVTGEELFDMITKGQVGFQDVDKALTSLTTGSGQFAGLLASQADTLSGSFSTLKDNISIVSRQIGDVLAPTAKDATKKLTEFLKSDKIIEWVSNFKRGIAAVSFTFSTLSITFDKVINNLSSLISNSGLKIEEWSLKLKLSYLKVKGLIKNTIDDQKEVTNALEENTNKQLEIEKNKNSKKLELEQAYQDAYIEARETFLEIDSAEKDVLLERQRQHNEQLTNENDLKNKTIIQQDSSTEKEKQKTAEETSAAILKDYQKRQQVIKAHRDISLKEEIATLKELLKNEKLTEEDKEKLIEKYYSFKETQRKLDEDKEKKSYEKLAEFAKESGEILVDTEKEFGQKIGEIFKNFLKDKIDAWVEAQIAELTIRLLAGDLTALAGLATVAGAGAAGKAAVDSIAFETGGVVGGNSFVGDKMPARLNSGERVLTREDQVILSDFLQGNTNNNQSVPSTIQVQVVLNEQVLGETIVDILEKERQGIL